jgi:uncharacterized protein (DUF58 family)
VNVVNSAWIGWALAAVAVALGYLKWGWPGVAMALTVVVFWLLLQFNRTLRVMRNAGQAPVGHVANAVMLHSKLKEGMRLIEILPLTRSLGRRVGDEPERFQWADASGDVVQVSLVNGRVTHWTLERAAPEGD